MKASEVTESGFYWWKAPERLVEVGLISGWQAIRVDVLDGVVLGHLTGEEVNFRDDDLEGELIGPIRTPSDDRSAALARWSKSRLDRIHALLGISQEMDRLNKGEGNEA